MNDSCQRELEKHAEPFSVLAWLNGGRYKHHIFKKIWKELLKNHIHDNICGVCIDDVHREMEERFEKVIFWSKKVVKNDLEWMISHINTSEHSKDGESYIIFNSCPKARSKIISIQTDKSIFTAIDSEGHILPSQRV